MAWQRSFCPLTGMVLVSNINRNFRNSFSPPYGDCTNALSPLMISGLFSPPYGDGTKTVQVPEYLGGFSPPYGDKLKSDTIERLSTSPRFRPLAGQPHYTMAADKLKSLFRASHSGGSLQR